MGSQDPFDIFQGEAAVLSGEAVIDHHEKRDHDKGCGPYQERTGEECFVFSFQYSQPPHLPIPVCS